MVKQSKKRLAALITGGGLLIGTTNAVITPPPDLIVPLERIIQSVENGLITEYVYLSFETEGREQGENYEKRMENAKFFDKENNEKSAKVYSGYPFYKEEIGSGYVWTKIKSATTTTDLFKKATEKKGLLGFLPSALADSSTINASTSDAAIAYDGTGGGSGWVVVHDAVSGTGIDDGANDLLNINETAGGFVVISRFFVPFDTSVLSTALTISSSTAYLYYAKASACVNGDNDGADFISLIKTTPANVASTTFDDYDQFGTDRGSDTNYDLTDICAGVNAYYHYDLNATGTSWIATSTWTQLGFREGHDLINEEIAIGTQNAVYLSTGSSANPPYIVVDYTVATGNNKRIMTPFMMR